MISDRHRLRVLAVACGLAALTFVSGACGDDSGDGDGAGSNRSDASGSKASTMDQNLKLAQCLRKHGIDVPDPKPGQDPEMTSIGGNGASPEQIEKAMKSCQDVAGLPEPKPLSPEQQDKMLKFAACMREHGIDMPDPKFDGGPGGGMSDAMPMPTDNDKMDKATKACAKFT
ncbi:hypothetical protein [Actinomadura geliboluensis]|uniref:Secreted protein n=1 Tax=Actinomadura geliboluensis TaxID=882440 RepID=A0A5S4H8V7_9ACTN|nr:hypothetical protein [Actinomadura geliboluensis]TMR41698.1 hypothetical protein ETD96_04145 [Actinomadura geliboluensis]